MAKVKVTELVAPLYEATRLLTKLKPQPTSALRFTTFCNQQTHVGESKQADVAYWVSDEDSDEIHVRCKQCGELTMDMILNPAATVENTPVNESADLDEIKPTTKPMDYLPIDAITIDQRLQARMEKELDMLVVADYAELMRDGVVFPPVVVFYDSLTSTRLLAEGFHRIAAAKQAGFTSISVTVIEGNERAAMLHSLGSNADHGKRRTNADKRYVVETMLKDDQWSAWSDREIGERCKVTHPFVAGIRKSLIPVSLETLPVSEVTKERTFTTKHGTTATMRTGNIGKKQEPVKPTTPSAKLAVDSAEPAVQPSKPTVSINTGAVSAMDDPVSLPVEKWDQLVRARYRYLTINLPSDCRYLLQFIHEAKQLRMWEKVEHVDMATGNRRPYKDIDDFVLNAFDLKPDMVKWAIDGLRMFKPNEIIPFDFEVVESETTVTDKPTIEKLQAELETMQTELKKAQRSKKYWENRVKDDERRECFKRQEASWKEQVKKVELGTDEYCETMKERLKEARKQMAKIWGLQEPISIDIWRRLIQLAHPDKHDGSTAAIEASQWLLKNKPPEKIIDNS